MIKVIVIDDDVDVGLFISRLLEKKFNCTVKRATDGIEALTMLKKYQPDIIFLDVTMPGMDGIQTMEAIKSAPGLKEIPIVMITAIGEKETVMRAMNMGALAYILKPLVYLPVYEKIKEIFTKLKSVKIIPDNKTVSNKNLELNKILIIDQDDSFVARVSGRFDENYITYSAKSGIDGLVLFNDEKPDVVIISDQIIDINLDVLTKRFREMAHKEIAIFIVKSENKLSDFENELWDLIIKK